MKKTKYSTPTQFDQNNGVHDIQSVLIGEIFSYLSWQDLKNVVCAMKDDTEWLNGSIDDHLLLFKSSRFLLRDSYYSLVRRFVEKEINVEIISSGFDNCIMQMQSGKRYGYGNNRCSQLGLGEPDDLKITTWREIPRVADEKIKEIVLGIHHSMMLTESGKVYVCGRNGCGQLGLGEDSDFEISSWIESDIPAGERVEQIVLGSFYSMILTKSGKMYGCGNNHCGQLALGGDADVYMPTWSEISLPEGEQVLKIALGDDHSMVLTKSGNMYGCGSNEYGQLGLGDTTENMITTWTLIPFRQEERVNNIVLGGYHSMMLTETGKVYGAGSNEDGQLSMEDADTDFITSWTAISPPEGEQVKKIVLKYLRSIMLTQSGKVFGCGANESDQMCIHRLEDRMDESVRSWSEIILPNNEYVDQIVIEASNSMVLTMSGTVYRCGKHEDANRSPAESTHEGLGPWREMPRPAAIENILRRLPEKITGGMSLFSERLTGAAVEYTDPSHGADRTVLACKL